jgi:heptosyltransferase II
MKILIIKLGFSETLDEEVSRFSSLGDVLRTTPILPTLKEQYPDSKITWLVDDAPYALLKGNKYIDRILIWDSFVGFQLLEERFDIVINLEKIAGLCAITNRINAWKKYGFRFDEVKGTYDVYAGSEYAFDLCTKHNIKKNNNKIWQEILIEMVGGIWKNQPYILGYKPKTQEIYDIGFNYKVGPKFPNKAWDTKNWKELEEVLNKENFSISWQEGLADLYEYIDWINKNKILVTSDSLGLHIALALGKKVVALFGPTNSKEVCFYNSEVIQKTQVSEISVEEVYEKIRKLT